MCKEKTLTVTLEFGVIIFFGGLMWLAWKMGNGKATQKSALPAAIGAAMIGLFALLTSTNFGRRMCGFNTGNQNDCSC